jgi:hypothetical protein
MMKSSTHPASLQILKIVKTVMYRELMGSSQTAAGIRTEAPSVTMNTLGGSMPTDLRYCTQEAQIGPSERP